MQATTHFAISSDTAPTFDAKEWERKCWMFVNMRSIISHGQKKQPSPTTRRWGFAAWSE